MSGKPTDEDIHRWLAGELKAVFPKATDLIKKMELDVHYKDVTYETLTSPGFFESLKTAFDWPDWDKAYDEFKAAGEKEQHKG